MFLCCFSSALPAVSHLQASGGNIPVEIQQQAVDLDEEVFGVAAPMAGPWQRQLNDLGGVKPLAFGFDPDLSSSWSSWRRRVRTKRPSGTSSLAA